LDVHATNEKGKTVLHYAATACAYSFYQLKFESERSAECIAVLIAAGAGPNAVSNKGKAALHQAARCGNTSSAKILLKAGANINAKDKAGKSALHYASFYAAETLRMLLAEGADVHDEDLLECAAKGCSHRDTSMARLLVDYYNKNEREIPKGAIPNLEALGIKILHD
jgi:ankyrin repeat protein